jgi:hypothetical protein
VQAPFFVQTEVFSGRQNIGWAQNHPGGRKEALKSREGPPVFLILSVPNAPTGREINKKIPNFR